MFDYFFEPIFWIGLGQIILIDIILSGDNAVVIALAVRSLKPHQQKTAIFWGTAAAIIFRLLLTIVATEMLEMPLLRIIGGLFLFRIAIQLMITEHESKDIKESSSMFIAIRTILIADAVMSLDNVISIAAVAHGNALLVLLGVAISIPFIVIGSTFLLKLMDRFPVIITAGAALLGWVAGEMLVTDPTVSHWIDIELPWTHVHIPLVGRFSWMQPLGALFVVVVGKCLNCRREEQV